jgi:hypothetical protein
MSDGFALGDIIAYPGVTISAAVPMRRFSLRAHDSALLASIIGLPLPTRIGETAGDIACLGLMMPICREERDKR